MMVSPKIAWLLLAILAVSTSVAAISLRAKPTTPDYATWESLEPDIWASAWLLSNHLVPQSSISMLPAGHVITESIPFGTPDSKYNRAFGGSAFKALLKDFGSTDPSLVRIGEAITDIESTGWGARADPLAQLIEQNFRFLQDRYGRAYVPIGCYERFFDTLHQFVISDPIESLAERLDHAVQDSACENHSGLNINHAEKTVTELPIETILADIAANRSVLFVDTREPEEYEKAHIPGAINLPMRQIDQSIIDSLRSYDRVIAYCVKDFRGYEVARMMKSKGLEQVAVMRPFGLAGWQASGLPLQSSQGDSDAAVKHLQECSKDRSTCQTFLSQN